MTWAATVLFSVQYRLALQRKVLGIIRIDRLLIISFTISSLLGSIYEIAWWITDSDDVGGVVLVFWAIGNLGVCGISTVFMLFQEIKFFLYGGLISLL